MIGGTSWHSTVEYYRIINEIVATRLGGHHSAKIILSSVDMDTLLAWANEENWNAITDSLIGEVRKLETGEADFFILCANALHKFADQLIKATSMPMLHIAEATAQKIREKKIDKVALLGTKYIIEDSFYQKCLEKAGIDVILPNTEQKTEINRVIYDDLAHGNINDISRKLFIDIINSLAVKGAKGIVLGCTEIPLLIKQEHVSIPVFNTTNIHAEAAANMALG